MEEIFASPSGRRRHKKILIDIQMLVNKIYHNYILLARLSNCGDTLRALTPTLFRKLYRGSRVMTGSDRKNVRDWAIRIQVPKFVMQEYGKGSTTGRKSA
jgi:hypothetical protein